MSALAPQRVRSVHCSLRVLDGDAQQAIEQGDDVVIGPAMRTSNEDGKSIPKGIRGDL
jgi:hypothetical protein